jgi:UDP-glucuronate decarboxylase
MDFDVEGIFNLACPASPIQYQNDPVRTLRTNVEGAINVLDLATKRNSRVLQASTSEVYGDPTVSPQSESYLGNVNPIGIRACYDEGKRASETLFFDYHRQYGVAIKVSRIFNTYGPRMDLQDGRVVSNFIVQSLRHNDISIYGDGKQTRSFCYVDDLIDGLVRLMNSEKSITGPINLGNPNEFTMISLANLIIDMTKSPSILNYTSLPADDPKQRRPDISKAAELLGWKPKIELAEGLQKTINEFSIRMNL